MGLTAVVVFLFVVFVLLLANRIWCSRRRAEDDETMVKMENHLYQDVDQSKEGKKEDEKEKKAKEEGGSNLGLELEDEKPADQEKPKNTVM